LALQQKIKENFNAYSQKIDSISIEIETLKQLTNSENQRVLLDSVQFILQRKLYHNNDLITIKVKNDAIALRI